MMNALMLFALKLTLVLAVGSALAALLRERSAATRHFVWALTLCSAVVLAVVTNVAPPLALAVPDWRPSSTLRADKVAGPARPALPAPRPQVAREAPVTAHITGNSPRGREQQGVEPLLRFLPVGIWFIGFAAMVGWLIAGHVSVSRIADGAVPADDEDWVALADEAASSIGVTRRTRVALSPAVGAPFTSGWSQPIILLPSDASSWPADRRRAALLHEMAHVARNDYLINLLAGLVCAIYWFHPVAWFALRRLRRESEHATDDRVIGRGMLAPDYATHLLDVARAARARGSVSLLAVGMACPSHLETRLRALLDEKRTRTTVSRGLAAAASAGVAMLLIPLAMAQPALRVSLQRTARRLESNADPVASGTASKSGRVATYQRALDASPGGTLVLDLETGAGVDIVGGDGLRVEISADLQGRDADKTVVDTERNGDEIRVTSKFDRPLMGSSTSHAFVIHVPRRFNVRLDSAGGDLSITGVEGTFEGSTGGGSIELTRLHGRARLSTGGGSIDVTDSDLEGSVGTGGGTVNLIRVRGGLRGESGGGSVLQQLEDLKNDNPVNMLSVLSNDETDDADRSDARARKAHTTSTGRLEIFKDGGRVNLAEASHGASITTGGGSISVGRAGGNVDVRTGGGRIDIGPVAGSVHAVTGAGNVEIKLADAGGLEQTVDVTTGDGNVVVWLPAGFDGRFELETAYTDDSAPVHIESAWGLRNEPVTAWDDREGTARRYVRAHGSAGRGRGLVRIHAVNGNVSLRRGD